ncbi:MAG: hypothetical protein FJX76_26755 [Armatimonadetes bacterium]|nr:hypothetical protein [Armatimonadota bacterium]
MGNFGGFTVRCQRKRLLNDELGVEEFLGEMVGRVVCDTCGREAVARPDGNGYHCAACKMDSPTVDGWRFDGLRDNFIDGFHEESFPRCKSCHRTVEVTKPFVFWAYDSYTHHAFHEACWPAEVSRLLQRRHRNEEAQREYEDTHRGPGALVYAALAAALALAGWYLFR